MADQVGGQQRDVVLPYDFCGLVQRQPLGGFYVGAWGVSFCVVGCVSCLLMAKPVCDVFAKTTNLISLVNDLFRHNLVMNYAGKTGRKIE